MRQPLVDPAVSPDHPGTAFTELQFYPPGWVEWPAFQVAVGAGSCDPTKPCAAMNVFSLLEDPVAGTTRNATCAAKIGLETFEFAFVTKKGRAQAPANPLDATLQTYTPDDRQPRQRAARAVTPRTAASPRKIQPTAETTTPASQRRGLRSSRYRALPTPASGSTAPRIRRCGALAIRCTRRRSSSRVR